jgi:hypothetical protein
VPFDVPKKVVDINQPWEKPRGEQTIKRRKPGETWDASLFYEPNNKPRKAEGKTVTQTKAGEVYAVSGLSAGTGSPAQPPLFALRREPAAHGRIATACLCATRTGASRLTVATAGSPARNWLSVTVGSEHRREARTP